MDLLDKNILAVNIEKRAMENIAAGKICGASVLVCQNGETVYKNCFGTVSPLSDIPVDDSTVYRIMSMTKPITAVAAMIMIERGLLSLDTPIEKYIPEFAVQEIMRENESGELVPCGKAKTKITVFHLLTHTSGIGSRPIWEAQFRKMTADDKKDLASSVKYFSRAGLAFEPFTIQAYSANAAFATLGRIIEIISGMNYNDFLRENIFEPCGMKDTTFTPSAEQWARMIKMHNMKDGVAVEAPSREGYISRDFPCTNFLGGSGLISTLEDYGNFAQMLLDGGVFGGRRIISEESVKALGTPQIPEELQPGAARWGLAMRVVVGKHRRPVGTYGWSGAYGTHFWVDPENGITAVYMKNSLFDGGSGAITSAEFESDVYNSFKE